MEQVPTLTWVLIGFLVVILFIPTIPDDENMWNKKHIKQK